MSLWLILLPVSVGLLLLAVWAFIWAVNAGQFDDLDTPAWEVLLEQAPSGHATQGQDDALPVCDAATPVNT